MEIVLKISCGDSLTIPPRCTRPSALTLVDFPRVKPTASAPAARFLSGVPESAAGAAVVALLAEIGARTVVIVSENLGRAEAVAEDSAFYAGLRGDPAP